MPRHTSAYQAAISCKGCRRPIGLFRVPAAHARASRANVAAELIRREREAAVCARCLGAERAARKAARRDQLAAEAAAAATRRADRGLTQDERALTVACPLVRCGAAAGEECLWIAGALVLGSGATHARRLESAYETIKAVATVATRQLELFA